MQCPMASVRQWYFMFNINKNIVMLPTEHMAPTVARGCTQTIFKRRPSTHHACLSFPHGLCSSHPHRVVVCVCACVGRHSKPMTTASPSLIRVCAPAAPAAPAVPASRPTAWTEHQVDNTGLTEQEIDGIRRAMRGKRIQPQKTLRMWFETAPWRIGCVRAYHRFTPTELQYLKTHHGFWTMKRWRRLFGCLLETDDAKRRRRARRSKRQPNRSTRDCFINMVSRQQGILHTTRGGHTTAPGMAMANLLRDVGRQEVDTYDRGNRILWKLPNGHIVCTTKRALTSMQVEEQHNVSEALLACKDMVKSELLGRRKRGAADHRTPRLRKHPRKDVRRMDAAAVETMHTVAMVAVQESSASTRRRPAARSPWAALGISLAPSNTTTAASKSVSARGSPSTPLAAPPTSSRAPHTHFEDDIGTQVSGDGFSVRLTC